MISYEKLLEEYKKLSIEKYYYENSSKNKSIIISQINSILKSKDDNTLLEINNILNIVENCNNNISLSKINEEKNKYLTYIQIFNRILASDIFYDISRVYINEFVKRREYFLNCIFILDNQIILYEGVEKLMTELDKKN